MDNEYKLNDASGDFLMITLRTVHGNCLECNEIIHGNISIHLTHVED